MRDPSMIQLGAAFPGMEHLPLAQLNRLMGKILRENSVLAHSYGSLTGCEELRSELAKRMLDAGCSIAPDQILITNGTNEAFHLCLQAIAQPGDTIAVESPTYFSVLEAMKTLQLKALTIPTHPREGISLTHLEDAFQTGKVKACLLVSNFSNPLGCCMSDVKKKQLVELLNQYNVLLIEDDVYGDIYFGSARPKAVKAFDTEDRVLYCSSVSKTLSPGMRTGWCSGGRYHARIAKLRSVMNFGTSLILQLTVAAFLANGGYDRHLRHLRRVYQHQINRMQQAIYDYFPVETCVSRPEGGHVLWLELPVAFDAVQLYQSALKHRIGIAPGVMFSASGKCYKNCFRLNTTASWTPEIDQAMQTLGHLSKKQLAEHLLRSTNR